VTRLNADGSPAAGPNNAYVSDEIVTVGRNPNLETGQESNLINGCGCIVATRKDPDRLKRYDFVINQSALEPALQEMMLGATIILDESSEPVPIGVWHPNQIGCAFEPSYVAFEFWVDAWVNDAPDSTFPYIHFLSPRMNWQEGNQTYGNEFTQPTLAGFTRSNPEWGEGIWGDMPEAVPTDVPGGWWYATEVLPTAECGYQTQAT
jgi:hypothetical protein